jgi:adenosylcobinamide-GDP ribazoletransferase
MLEIMKDPHCGAFAVIWCATFLLASFGVHAELAGRGLELLSCFSYPLARCGSAFFTLFLPQARPGGMLSSFAGLADKKACSAILAAFALACGGCLAWRPLPFAGGLAGFIVCGGFFRRMALSRFGGITGDLAGFHTVASELSLCLGFLAGGIACAKFF